MNLKLSIIVNFHNMPREACRTLFTLSADYQREMSVLDYEIIVIDNGSTEPLGAEFVTKFGSNFHYYFLNQPSSSPAYAMNYGVRRAKGEFVACIVDGARMVTPGILRYSLQAAQAFPHPFVCALAWHLGPDVQNSSMLNGYNQGEEDCLLESINWREDGYQLFQVSTLAQSSGVGFLGGLPEECSYFMMSKASFLELGGFDEDFQSPGGGLVNHDFLKRAVDRQEFNHVVLLGEGSFHQFHGGVATNCPLSIHPWQQFADEYELLRGQPYKGFKQPLVHYLGSMPCDCDTFIKQLAKNSPSKKGQFLQTSLKGQ